MKKKIKIMILLMVVLVGCTACNGTITREIRHAGFSIGDTFECKNFFPENKDDTSYEKIKYFTSSRLINTEGKIYELSIGQTFANDQNCKPAETNLVVKAILDDRIVKGTDNKYYYLTGQNNVAAYTLVPEADNSYQIYDLLLKEESVIKVVTADSSKGLYYVLKDDGNVYGYTISRAERNAPPAVTSSTVVFSKNDYGSKIVDFNYAGDSLNTFVKTEEKVFRMMITNNEKCSKYADVACEYEIKEDPVLVTYKDNIIAYNGSTIITDYQQMFNVGS